MRARPPTTTTLRTKKRRKKKEKKLSKWKEKRKTGGKRPWGLYQYFLIWGGLYPFGALSCDHNLHLWKRKISIDWQICEYWLWSVEEIIIQWDKKQKTETKPVAYPGWHTPGANREWVFGALKLKNGAPRQGGLRAGDSVWYFIDQITWICSPYDLFKLRAFLNIAVNIFVF